MGEEAKASRTRSKGSIWCARVLGMVACGWVWEFYGASGLTFLGGVGRSNEFPLGLSRWGWKEMSKFTTRQKVVPEKVVQYRCRNILMGWIEQPDAELI